MEEPAFTGFPAGALPFLRRLKRNNDREWFAERKEEYERLLAGPMLALARELAGVLHEAGLPVVPRQRNPVFRIYRDIRFSNDKTPFKTNVASALHRDGDKRVDGIVYLHIDPAGSFVAAGFWQPEKAALGRWRDRIADSPEELLAIDRALPLDRADTLTRLPRGFERFADTPAAPLLRLRSCIVQEPLPPEALAGRAVVDRAAAFAQRAEPLLRYGWGLAPAKPV